MKNLKHIKSQIVLGLIFSPLFLLSSGCLFNGGGGLNINVDALVNFLIIGFRMRNIPESDKSNFVVKVQADRKIVSAGYLRDANGKMKIAVMRYYPDGSLDTAFGTGGTVLTSVTNNEDVAQAVAIQSDGKILISGTSFDNALRSALLVRYNTDGSLDTSFGTGGVIVANIVGNSDGSMSLALQSDGKIIIGGFTGNNSLVARYNTNGSIDTTFGGGNGYVSIDFAHTEAVLEIMIRSNGKIVLGTFEMAPPIMSYGGIVQLNSDGTIDTAFGTNGIVELENTGTDLFLTNAFALQADGKVLVTGTYLVLDGTNDPQALTTVSRVSVNGALDTSFGTNGRLVLNIPNNQYMLTQLIPQSDGKFIGLGTVLDISGFSLINAFQGCAVGVVRFNADGTLDTSFGSGHDGTLTIGFADKDAYGISGVIQADNKLVVVGQADSGANAKFFVGRLWL